ncbi:SICA antigen [Plasmodium coatneyi]|uniref:SICA antigen n=1 Tax=Plasmodium coatneyi TaxID=208452 RepID=A0A1B1E0N7_9APIC|nr:SICA antigen [Plasmodium coatneyi]ANQ08417.1 SICA antigen [Plasmodium coatneyi]
MNYFVMLGKRRKRYKRAHQVRGPLPLEQQIVDHVDDVGPHEYYLVKERKPHSTSIKRRKKRGVGRCRAGRHPGVRRRMIIDIHLEVLNECQKMDLHSTKEDFFEILKKNVPEEDVPSSDSGFREEDFVPTEDIRKEQFPCSHSGFREDDFVAEESLPKETVPSSDSAFREENFIPKEDFVPKEQVPSSGSGFRVNAPEEHVLKEGVSREDVPSSDSGF